MRLGIATTALLFANRRASADVILGSSHDQIPMAASETRRTKHRTRTTLRGSNSDTQPNNSEGSYHHPKKLRNPSTVKKLLNKLATNQKSKEGAMLNKSDTIGSENEPQLPLAHEEYPDVPDLGVLGGSTTASRHKRRLIREKNVDKQSIMDKDSIREPAPKNDKNNGVSSNAASTTNIEGYDAMNITEYYMNTDEENYYENDGPNESNTFMIPSLQNICEEYGGGYCDCGNFDFDSMEGTIECKTGGNDNDYCTSTINYCGEPIEVCYRETIVLDASGPEDYSYTTCLTYSRPYHQHVCISFDSGDNKDAITTPDPYASDSTILQPYMDGFIAFSNTQSTPCSVQFNNMECNSCSVEVHTYQETFLNEIGLRQVSSMYQERCFKIDCSNDDDDDESKKNIINTCSDRAFPTTLRDNLVFGDDCTRCQPCGLGYQMTNPNGEGIFPLIGEYKCSGLELAAKVGFFDRKLCEEVQSKTIGYCGCEPIFYYDTTTTPDRIPPTSSFARFENSTGSHGSINESANGYYIPIVLPGNTIGDQVCDVCGSSSAVVANPTALVDLPNTVTTSCSALQAAGNLGMFTSDYCRRHVMPLVFQNCGGCFHEEITDVDIAAAADVFNIASDIDPYVDANDDDDADTDKYTNAGADVDSDAAIANITSVEDTVETKQAVSNVDDLWIPSSTTFIVGEDSESCQICDMGSEVAEPDNLVPLSNGVTSCKALEDGLKSGTIFTETFCLQEAAAFVDTYCGGCVVVNNDVGIGDIAQPSSSSSSISSEAASQLAINALKLGRTGKEDEENLDGDTAATEGNVDDYDDDDESVGVEMVVSRVDGEADQKPKSTGRLHREDPEELDVEADPMDPVVSSVVSEETSSGSPQPLSLLSPLRSWLTLFTTAMVVPFSIWMHNS